MTDKGEKARVRAVQSIGSPDVEIWLQCSVCNHTWVESFPQPIESIKAQQCDACNKWDAVMSIVERMARYASRGRVTRDNNVSGELIDAMAEYATAHLEPEPKGGDAPRPQPPPPKDTKDGRVPPRRPKEGGDA